MFTRDILILGCLLGASYVSADVLELKSGGVHNGSYLGGTQGTVRFEVGTEIKVFPVNEVMAITFTGESVTSNSAPPAAPMAKTQAAASSNNKKIAAAGSRILVKTTEEVGTHNKGEGDRFTGMLEGNLMSGSQIMASSGAQVYGKILISEKGGIGSRKAILEITLTDIKIDGQLRSITTSVLRGEGKSGGLGRKILKGAAIGKMADGNEGAERGAKWAAGIGMLQGGKHAGMKSGSVIEFTLTKALSL